MGEGREEGKKGGRQREGRGRGENEGLREVGKEVSFPHKHTHVHVPTSSPPPPPPHTHTHLAVMVAVSKSSSLGSSATSTPSVTAPDACTTRHKVTSLVRKWKRASTWNEARTIIPPQLPPLTPGPACLNLGCSSGYI